MADETDFSAHCPRVTLLWLEITERCQLACVHCYASSGPSGSHGTMTVEMWRRVIDQATAAGVRLVKFIGGEPLLHPGLPQLVEYAVHQGLRVSVYSNLLHVPAAMWPTLSLRGVELETSYYSAHATHHDAITGRRGSHRRTTATIREAVRRGVRVGAALVTVHDGQRVVEAEHELRRLGARVTTVDHVRSVGRAASAADGGGRAEHRKLAELCGLCASSRLAISPDGTVRPCVLARWISLGNVCEQDLSSIIADQARRWSMNSRIVMARQNRADGSHPAGRCAP
jgi:MoaA/NifB/PqqE/SkfB family radical SAM enzyme